MCRLSVRQRRKLLADGLGSRAVTRSFVGVSQKKLHRGVRKVAESTAEGRDVARWKTALPCSDPRLCGRGASEEKQQGLRHPAQIDAGMSRAHFQICKFKRNFVDFHDTDDSRVDPRKRTSLSTSGQQWPSTTRQVCDCAWSCGDTVVYACGNAGNRQMCAA